MKKPEASYLPAYAEHLRSGTTSGALPSSVIGAGAPVTSGSQPLSSQPSFSGFQEVPASQTPYSEPFKNLLLPKQAAAADVYSPIGTSGPRETSATGESAARLQGAVAGGFDDASITPPTSTAGKPMDDSALLVLPGGKEVRLDILRETVPSGIVLDIRSLYNEHGVLVFDPGFSSTCSCASAITKIDGERGLCLYRGYPVHELTQSMEFLDVAFLLLYGDAPSTAAKKMFEKQVKEEMLLHNRLCDFIKTFVPGAHPMSILASVVSAFASFYADPMSVDHINSWEQRELACIRLIAKMPTVVAMAYKTLIGEPPVYPRADMSYAENFLHMMFATPMQPYLVNPLHAKIIDTFLTIHADHEQNASTSTVRTAGSSMANPYACIATGITSLWGRAHGGANEAVIRMLQDIRTSENIADFVQRVKNKQVRLMGFGHRVYRNYDPRARLMRDLCYQLRASGDVDPLFELALQLEQVAIKDDYFVSRHLYPNVDFYSGVVMRGLRIPPEMFTAMFALGRCVGWLSHWKEMVQEGQMKIARPRQLYLGERMRHAVTVPRSIHGKETLHRNGWAQDHFEEVHAAGVKEREAHCFARGSTVHLP